MKVEKVTGWIQGQNGKGNVFEVSTDAGYLLAVMYPDGTFHPITLQSLNDHIAAGKGNLDNPRSSYVSMADKVLTVDNPTGWQRLFTITPTPGTEEPTTEEPAFDGKLKIPVKFDGVFEIDLSALKQILNLFEITD